MRAVEPGTHRLLVVALLVRLVPILMADRLVADVLRYHKVAVGVLDGTWNPYELPRLYPYPPVWVWFEAGSEWLARRLPVSFPVLVKLPVLAADLAVVTLLARWSQRRGLGAVPAWLYALHPVSILITGFHGQFDAIPLLFVLLALVWHEGGALDRSALALAAGIAIKSFPVLLLPFFLLAPGATPRGRLRFGVLAMGPVALLLVPFAMADWTALRRELFAYSGVADFGWIGLYRGLLWLTTGVLRRSEPQHWGALIPVGKVLFLGAYGLMLGGYGTGRLRWSLPEACLAVFLAFQAIYGSLSAQYLLWVVPLGVLFPGACLVGHGVAATLALLGFYAFLQPSVLNVDPQIVAYTPEQAGLVWVLGVGAVTAMALAWLASLVRKGLA